MRGWRFNSDVGAVFDEGGNLICDGVGADLDNPTARDDLGCKIASTPAMEAALKDIESALLRYIKLHGDPTDLLGNVLDIAQQARNCEQKRGRS